jgi:hypothetical protein
MILWQSTGMPVQGTGCSLLVLAECILQTTFLVEESGKQGISIGHRLHADAAV